MRVPTPKSIAAWSSFATRSKRAFHSEIGRVMRPIFFVNPFRSGECRRSFYRPDATRAGSV